MNLLNHGGTKTQRFTEYFSYYSVSPCLRGYLLAANEGCWISLDGLGWDLEKHVEKILFAREHKILNRVLISHDAGWYDPQKQVQAIKPYTNIFKQLYPALTAKGFSKEEFDHLISDNPAKAFSINIKKR